MTMMWSSGFGKNMTKNSHGCLATLWVLLFIAAMIGWAGWMTRDTGIVFCTIGCMITSFWAGRESASQNSDR